MGFLLSLIYLLQFSSGILLSCYYSSFAGFSAVYYIMIEVNVGWLIRFVHVLGASMFMFFILFHWIRGTWIRLKLIEQIEFSVFYSYSVFYFALFGGFFGGCFVFFVARFVLVLRILFNAGRLLFRALFSFPYALFGFVFFGVLCGVVNFAPVACAINFVGCIGFVCFWVIFSLVLACFPLFSLPLVLLGGVVLVFAGVLFGFVLLFLLVYFFNVWFGGSFFSACFGSSFFNSVHLSNLLFNYSTWVFIFFILVLFCLFCALFGESFHFKGWFSFTCACSALVCFWILLIWQSFWYCGGFSSVFLASVLCLLLIFRRFGRWRLSISNLFFSKLCGDCAIFDGVFINSLFNTVSFNWIWISGLLIWFFSLAISFLGYCLCWGQMSYWGITVMINIFTILPIFGSYIGSFLWCSSLVVLNKIFMFHFFIGFIIGFVILVHISLLHLFSSFNLVSNNYSISLVFYSMFFKDCFVCYVVFSSMSLLLFFEPDIFGSCDNLVFANPMSTPNHIVPEWYFLLFYALLRSFPNKTVGVIIVSLFIIIFLI